MIALRKTAGTIKAINVKHKNKKTHKWLILDVVDRLADHHDKGY